MAEEQKTDQTKIWLEVFKVMLPAALDFGKEAIKVSLLINGGASIAILALVGQIAGKVPKEVIAAMSPAISSYSFGVMFGAIATGLGYLAQYNYGHSALNEIAASEVRRDKQLFRGRAAHYGCAFFVIASYLAFGIGCCFSANSFKTAAWPAPQVSVIIGTQR